MGGRAWQPTASLHMALMERLRQSEEVAARREAELVCLRAERDDLRAERDELRVERDSLMTHSAEQTADMADLARAIEASAKSVYLTLQVHEAAMPDAIMQHTEPAPAATASPPPLLPRPQQQQQPPQAVLSQLRILVLVTYCAVIC